MGLIIFLIVGALAGWLASVVMKSDSQQGLLGDILLGVFGAIVGGFLLNFLGEPGPSGFNLYSILVATIGAIFLIWVGRMFNQRRV